VASLVAARCPTCGAGLKIDVDQEIASCNYCNTSAFVKTNKRPVTQHVRQQRVPVIDASSQRLLWSLLAIPFVLFVAGAVAALSASSQRDAVTELSPAASEAPAALPEPPAPSVAVPTEDPPARAAPPGMKFVDLDGLKILRPDPDYVRPAPKAASARPDVPLSQRPAPKVSVSQANLSVSGPLGKEQVSGAIGRALGQAGSCYRQALASDPGLTATSTLRFVVQADGSVTNLANQGSAMPLAMKDCVLSAYRNLRFPTSSNGGSTTVLSKLSYSAV
jgi:hypothetical protein